MNNIALIAFHSIFLTHSRPIFSHLNRPFRESQRFPAERSLFCCAIYFAMQAIIFVTAFALLCKGQPQQETVCFLPLPGSIGHLARKSVH